MGRRRPPYEGMTEKPAPYLRTFSLDTEVLELREVTHQTVGPVPILFTLRIKPDADMKTQRRPQSQRVRPFDRPCRRRPSRNSKSGRHIRWASKIAPETRTCFDVSWWPNRAGGRRRK
jgi:hypothetical protein